MAFNPNVGMNAQIRRAGNRSRMLPNIGQSPIGDSELPGTTTGAGGPSPLNNAPAVQVTNAAMGMGGAGGVQPQPQTPPASQPAPQTQPGMAAPNVQPATFTMHPPGSPPDPSQYNYEPQPDGAWRVYPPGVPAPPHALQASLPRAASTADYRRMRQAFDNMLPQRPQ